MFSQQKFYFHRNVSALKWSLEKYNNSTNKCARKEFGRESSMQDTVGVHEDIPTLLEILKEEGYVTGITQKWHLSPHWKYPFDYRLQSPRLPVTSGAQSVKTFLNMVRRKNKDDPFFLMVNFGNTHREWQSGIDGRYKVKTDNVVLPVGLPDIPMVRQDYANYLSSVQTMDAAIGHVLEELEESGEMDRTIIIYTSDQGMRILVPKHQCILTEPMFLCQSKDRIKAM